jgi:probable rRNA maturation factor
MPHKAASELSLWNRRAKLRLEDLIDCALHFPALRKLGPRKVDWQAGVRVVGSAEIRKLNARYRKKDQPTDVLSFGSPEPFWSLGHLGELVIALPILKRQARALGHSAEVELQVLLSHGLLHLLGMDHEKGKKQALEQSRWEARLLAFSDITPDRGLVGRVGARK